MCEARGRSPRRVLCLVLLRRMCLFLFIFDSLINDETIRPTVNAAAKETIRKPFLLRLMSPSTYQNSVTESRKGNNRSTSTIKILPQLTTKENLPPQRNAYNEVPHKFIIR